MKKTILMVVLLSTAAVAKTALGAKAIVMTVGMTVAGVVLLPGLVVGDAQGSFYRKSGLCDSNHFIYTIAPTGKNAEKFSISVKIPCPEWPSKGETF